METGPTGPVATALRQLDYWAVYSYGEARVSGCACVQLYRQLDYWAVYSYQEARLSGCACVQLLTSYIARQLDYWAVYSYGKLDYLAVHVYSY